ncbi:MAG: hypothetical protein VYA30_13160 [Myxococcota bacterium]|nr:hypothetical protein [Myxococcota bacterium]
MSVSHLYIFLCLPLVLAVGCGAGESDNRLLEGEPVYLLQSRYALTTELIDTNCALSLAELASSTSSVEVRQTGNYINWTQYPADSDGQSSEPMSMTGAVCETADGTIELRLRGRAVSRRSYGTGYCRTEFSIPASPLSCLGRVDEICSDPQAFVLTLDRCSGGFFGRTNSCLRYEESCAGTADCQLAFEFAAYPAGNTRQSDECSVQTHYVDNCRSSCDACDCMGGS